jgi:CRP/FNR family transcriptional regulator, cyclic AMP receptor protein
MADHSILKNVYLFDGLSEEDLEKVFDICKPFELKENEKLFSEGDAGDELFIIVSGEIRISKLIGGLGEEALAVLKDGNFFGEMSLVDDVPRSADAISNKASSLLRISREDFLQLLMSDKDLALTLLMTFVKTLSLRLRQTNEKVKAFLAMAGGF